MLILVDSREQKPYWTGSQCAKTCLIAGDYTTATLHNVFHIERKSGIDLYGTITKGNVRFRKEIIRAKENGVLLVVVVELTKKRFEAKDFYGGEDRLVKGETLIRIVNTFTKKYGIEFIWCKHRTAAQAKVLRLLKQKEAEYNATIHRKVRA